MTVVKNQLQVREDEKRANNPREFDYRRFARNFLPADVHAAPIGHVYSILLEESARRGVALPSGGEFLLFIDDGQQWYNKGTTMATQAFPGSLTEKIQRLAHAHHVPREGIESALDAVYGPGCAAENFYLDMFPRERELPPGFWPNLNSVISCMRGMNQYINSLDYGPDFNRSCYGSLDVERRPGLLTIQGVHIDDESYSFFYRNPHLLTRTGEERPPLRAQRGELGRWSQLVGEAFHALSTNFPIQEHSLYTLQDHRGEIIGFAQHDPRRSFHYRNNTNDVSLHVEMKQLQYT